MPDRIYVNVNSDFDSTGYMLPRSITWKDGRTFRIEAVKDYRPASAFRKGMHHQIAPERFVPRAHHPAPVFFGKDGDPVVDPEKAVQIFLSRHLQLSVSWPYSYRISLVRIRFSRFVSP